MRFFRYRKPSVKTILGLTKAKKRVKRKTGITAVTRPARTVTNFKRRVKRKMGYYSAPAKLMRAKKPPTPVGCLVPVVLVLIITMLLV